MILFYFFNWIKHNYLTLKYTYKSVMTYCSASEPSFTGDTLFKQGFKQYFFSWGLG